MLTQISTSHHQSLLLLDQQSTRHQQSQHSQNPSSASHTSITRTASDLTHQSRRRATLQRPQRHRPQSQSGQTQTQLQTQLEGANSSSPVPRSTASAFGFADLILPFAFAFPVPQSQLQPQPQHQHQHRRSSFHSPCYTSPSQASPSDPTSLASPTPPASVISDPRPSRNRHSYHPSSQSSNSLVQHLDPRSRASLIPLSLRHRIRALSSNPSSSSTSPTFDLYPAPSPVNSSSSSGPSPSSSSLSSNQGSSLGHYRLPPHLTSGADDTHGPPILEVEIPSSPPQPHSTAAIHESPSDSSQDVSMQMSRPSTGNSGTGPGGGGARPTHIALPAGHFQSGGSPLQTPTPLAGGAASPASPRHSFLGFMRGRGRSNTLSNVNSAAAGAPSSPSLERGNPLTAPASRGGSSREGSTGPHGGGGGGAGREGNAGASTTAAGTVTRSISTPLSGGLSAPSTAATATGTPAPRSGPGGGVGLNINNPVPVILPAAAQGSSLASTSTSQTPSKTYRIRLVPHLESQRSLAFDPVVRELVPIVVPPGVQPAIAAQSFIGAGPTVNGRLPALILKIGRFTDKSNPPALPVPGDSSASGTAGSSTIGPNGIVNGNGAGPSASLAIAGGGGDVTSGKAAFKSKVVSRSHAEIWCEPGGKFYIRDTASSSGTFLNHIRLSSPNTESRPTMLNDGDVLQLGVDYQGGTEEMFRCVKMRVEVGREWQRGANEFNTNALKQLKALGGAPESKSKSSAEATPSKKAKASVTDCCICLFSVTVCQSLFIAPCSHVFHYKCIRPLLLQHHPGFSCPLCRTFANLEEDVETEDAWEIASRRASIISRKPSNHSIRLPSASQADPAPSSPGAGPSGQPSTGISLGVSGAAASVDELLAAPSAEGGEASTAEDEDQTNGTGRGMIGSSALLRQTTAVAHPASGVAGETGDVTVDVPSMVREDEDEDIEGADRFLTAETNASNSFGLHHENQPTSVPVPIGTLSLRDGNGHDHGQGNSDFDVATPMNEHFLSTLVGGAVGAAPGIDQRLALAEEVGSSDHGHAETNGNSNEARREADMMYT